jgi:hypothetical protein
VDLVRWQTHLDERPGGAAGRDGDGIGGLVDLFFAVNVSGIGDWKCDAPALIFLGDDLLLISDVGGAAVADEDASSLLKVEASPEACAGDGDSDEARSETEVFKVGCASEFCGHRP